MDDVILYIPVIKAVKICISVFVYYILFDASRQNSRDKNGDWFTSSSGPDWMWGEQAGEGGILEQSFNVEKMTSTVQFWFVGIRGKQTNYRAGHSGKFNLRV